MTDTRKTLTFKLPESSTADFNTAKQRAERELGITLRDNDFARRVVVQAVKSKTEDHSK